MDLNKKILVVVVLYNAENWLQYFLSPILGSREVDILCIDNNSGDETCRKLKEEYKEVMLIKNKENLGFGKANNIGLEYFKKSTHDYVFLLNQDARITENALVILTKLLDENSSYGILSPVHRSRANDRLDFNFVNYLREDNTPGLIEDLVLKSPLRKIYTTDFVNAALWCISRACFEKVGYFDPMFPHYGEDVDYVKRVNNAGFLVGVVPTVYGNHAREKSSNTIKSSSLNSEASKNYAVLLVKYKYYKKRKLKKVAVIMRDFLVTINESVLLFDFGALMIACVNYPKILREAIFKRL